MEYDNSETPVRKVAAGRIQICFDYFVKSIFYLSFFETSDKEPQQKSPIGIGFA